MYDDWLDWRSSFRVDLDHSWTWLSRVMLTLLPLIPHTHTHILTFVKSFYFHTCRWRAVGQSLARVVYVHVCLMLETEARAPPTKASVWRAEQVGAGVGIRVRGVVESVERLGYIILRCGGV